MKFCPHCEEPLLSYEDIRVCLWSGFILEMHLDCLLRGVIGSVGHQIGQCSCHGKADRSEDGMTKRQAAGAAWKHFQKHRQTPTRCGSSS